MPQNITIAAFVFGAVLVLIALLSGGFKIFGVEISGTTGRLGRIVAGVVGALFITIGLYGSFEKSSVPLPFVQQPRQAEKAPRVSGEQTSSPVKEPQAQPAPTVQQPPREETEAISAERTPSPVKEPQIQSVRGIGTLKLPNVKTRTVEVYSQDSSGASRYAEGYAGTLSPEATTLQLPTGKYKLKFAEHFLENVEVKVKQPSEILLGAIRLYSVNRTVEVYSQDSSGASRYAKGYAGTLSPEATTLQLPTGKYKLKFAQFFLENIVVKSGEETVLEQ